MSDIDQLRTDLQATGRVLIEQKLTLGNAGNLSARVTPTTLLATTTR